MTRARDRRAPARTAQRASTTPLGPFTAVLAALLVACAATPPEAEAARQPRAARPAAAPAPAAKPPAVRDDRSPDVVTYGRREDVMRFADEVSQRQNLPREWVQAQLAQARFVPRIPPLMMPPPTGSPKNWAAYRDRFIEPRRIDAGLLFWNANAGWLERAEQRWGVPASVIVGIVGVETFYGRITGNFRVLDALATLAFDFPTGRRDRTPFFRDELEQFLVLCHRSGQADCIERKGSYAGAMGLPQFMPSSVLKYAVDFDGDGMVDLSNSAADVIGSVAHYLHAYGWHPGLPTHFPALAPADEAQRAVLLGPDIVPSFAPAEMTARGAQLPPEAQAHPGLLALVELENGEAARSHVAGTHNFYVVTRYNWSSYYALAVIELGNAIQRLRAPR